MANFSMGDFLFGESGRFELYSIEIQKLGPNRGLSKIWMIVNSKSEILYEPVDKEKIPIGNRLPLKGPSQPVDVHFEVTIVFGDPNDPEEIGWMFRVMFDEECVKGFCHGPQEVVVIDPDSGSRALVRYGLYFFGVDATFELRYEGLTNIKISKCEIYATTNYDDRSKCLLLCIGPTEMSNRRDEPYEISPGEMINLGRSRLGMPLLDRSRLGMPLCHGLSPLPIQPYLRFQMDLEYYEEEASSGKIRGPFKIEVPPTAFGVPDSPSNSDLVVFNLEGDASLNLMVKWTDALMNVTLEMLLKPTKDSVEKAFGPHSDGSCSYKGPPDEDCFVFFEPPGFELDYSAIDRELDENPQLRVQVGGEFMGERPIYG